MCGVAFILKKQRALLKMDIKVAVTDATETFEVAITISYCDTDETMLYHIADTVDSLPEYLGWDGDLIPSWKTLADTTEFQCNNYLPALKNSEFVEFPKSVPKTEHNQKLFLTTHSLAVQDRYLQYFDQQEFTIPLNDASLKPFHDKELELKHEIMLTRDRNLSIGEGAMIQTNDATTRYKRFVVQINFNNLGTVFDSMIVSDTVPFAMFKSVLKTVSHFRPPNDWIELGSESNIIFKIKHDSRPNEFTTGVITLDKLCYCILDTADFYKTIDENTLLSNLQQCLGDENLTLVEQSTFLTYDLVGIEFHACYLSDMIMHDLFSLFYVDEYVKPNKNKNRLYLHMADASGTINIFQKHTHKPFQFNVKPGTPFISMRIKTDTIFMSQRLKQVVLSLMSYYAEKVADVTHFYDRYLPARPVHKILKQSAALKKPLKLIAPDIFLPMYSRRCLNMPTIVEQSQVKKRPFIKFPLFGESQARLYICDHKKYKYPGLRVNELDNRISFPFVPCCYSKDQNLNPDSKLNKYINKTVVTPKINHSQGAILNLPVQLKRYFTFVDTLHAYILLSNPVGPHSFLGAVYYAIEKKVLTDALIKELEVIDPTVCAQEIYPTDLKHGLFPREHIRLLEYFFGITIFLFDKNGPLLPKFARRYLKAAPGKKSVFIFVKGPEHCLPLVRSGAPSAYTTNSKTVSAIYNHNELMSPLPFTNQAVYEYFSKYNVVGQILNTERHCVFFVCEMDGIRIPIATKPQLPFPSPIIAEIERVNSYASIAGIFPSSKCIVLNGIVREVAVPFAPGARILCDFPATELPKKTTIGDRELFQNMVEIPDYGIHNFFMARKDVINILNEVEVRIVADEVPPERSRLIKWLKANKYMFPPMPKQDLIQTRKKMAYLLMLKFANTPDKLGTARDLDLNVLEPRPTQIISSDMAVMEKNITQIKYKPEMALCKIGDVVLLDGRSYKRIAEESDIPEVIYNPETDQYYDADLEDLTPKVYPKFTTWVAGAPVCFGRVRLL